MQALDVLEPERLPGEGDRPVLALTPEHRPRGSAVRSRGRRERRPCWVAVPADAGEVVPCSFCEGRHPEPPGRAERGLQQFGCPLPVTRLIARKQQNGQVNL